MVVQNPYQMGFEGVKLMHAVVTDNQSLVTEMYPDYAQEGERDIYRTELRVVAPDGDGPLTKDLFDESTILFKNSEFQDWLKERGLISS
jgi:ribose transport system substrate-binding protein